MKYYYHEPQIGKKGNADCAVKGYGKPMPVYPKALRFCITNYEQASQYMQGAEDFIKSTKIPESCDKCPVDSLCGGYNATIMCRVLWRKIWGYVK